MANRSRTPFVLTATLLLAIVAILGFTIRLLQTQRTILEQALQDTQTDAMRLLAYRLERVILSVSREPFRVFKNIPQTNNNLEQRLSWMRTRFPEVKQVLFLDGRMQRIASYPPPMTETQQTLESWLIEQIKSSAIEATESPASLSTLVTSVAGASTFFSWQPVEGEVVVGIARVDFRRHRLTQQGSVVEVSAKELDLLHYLVLHRGEVVTRDSLLADVWGHSWRIATRTVDNFIVRLRKKIEPDPAVPRYLLTVHGRGYKLVD